MPAPAGPALVFGAGAIGCWIGARLQAAGADVIFVGRRGVVEELRGHGARITDLDGGRVQLEAAAVQAHESIPQRAAPALVLLAVKAHATAEAAAILAQRLGAGTPVLSLQNGVGNCESGRAAAPALQWIPAMVGFNVVHPAAGHWHRASWGSLAAQRHPALAPWLPRFAAAGLPLELHHDLLPVQWGKLLLNLGNPVNALSGLPLREQLLDRDLRCVMAALIAEALAALQAHGVKPARLSVVPPALMPHALRLPTWLFKRLARRSLHIDAQARTSMAEDLARGRRTEVDALCGEVVRLAERAGLGAPANAWMVQRLSQAAPGTLGGREMRQALGV